MKEVTAQELFEAGVHFGHSVSSWHPKIKKYLYGEKGGILVFDIEKTVECLKVAGDFAKQLAAQGGTFLFVGTKHQIREIIKEEAIRCGAYYVVEHWLGGTLTNFTTVRKSVEKLQKLEEMKSTGEIMKLTKKERNKIEKLIVKMTRVLEGIRDMTILPDALFVIDIKRENVAIREAQKLNIPVIAIVDTNANPDEVEYPIPGNDDAMKSVKVIAAYIADAIIEGKKEKEAQELQKSKESA